MGDVRLVLPEMAYLPAYRDALERGFSPDNLSDISKRELAKLEADAEGHLASMNGTQEGMFITLPTGAQVPRLPMMTWWIWDGEFSGVMKFRYQKGTNELPPHVLGHVGYGVPEWKRGRGYATKALGLILPHVREAGVTELLLTCKPDNVASQKVITANGGVLLREITVPEYGDAKRLLFGIAC